MSTEEPMSTEGAPLAGCRLLRLFPLLVSEETSQYWGWGDRPFGGRGVGRESEAREAGGNATTTIGAEDVEENAQLLLQNALKGLVDSTCTLACALAGVTTTPR